MNKKLVSKILFYLKQLNLILRSGALLFLFFDLNNDANLQDTYHSILQETEEIKQVIQELQEVNNQ